MGSETIDDLPYLTYTSQCQLSLALSVSYFPAAPLGFDASGPVGTISPC